MWAYRCRYVKDQSTGLRIGSPTPHRKKPRAPIDYQTQKNFLSRPCLRHQRNRLPQLVLVGKVAGRRKMSRKYKAWDNASNIEYEIKMLTVPFIP